MNILLTNTHKKSTSYQNQIQKEIQESYKDKLYNNLKDIKDRYIRLTDVCPDVADVFCAQAAGLFSEYTSEVYDLYHLVNIAISRVPSAAYKSSPATHALSPFWFIIIITQWRHLFEGLIRYCSCLECSLNSLSFPFIQTPEVCSTP